MLNWKCGTMAKRQLNLQDYFRQGPTSKTKQAIIIIDTDSKGLSSPADDVNTEEDESIWDEQRKSTTAENSGGPGEEEACGGEQTSTEDGES